jgi:hypothetical protein
MQVKTKLELTLEKYEKCFAICDSDCSLGELYDFACSFQFFVMEKMKEAEEAKKQRAPEVKE